MKADYGLDAPAVVKSLCGFAMTAMFIAAIMFLLREKMPRGVGQSIGLTFLISGLFMGSTAWLMLRGSRWGKLRMRDRLLDRLAWRGDEHVLDVGCGHGLMLIGAAKRAPRGRAVGVDIWNSADQAANSAAATRGNAQCEGVEIELVDGDARQLPFGDKEFDVAVSSFALHNIYDAPGREKAITEIARILKTGGKAAIIDIRHSREYALVFEKLGMKNVQRLGPDFTFVLPSYAVLAEKP